MPQGQTSWLAGANRPNQQMVRDPATELSNRAKKLFTRAKSPRSRLGDQFCEARMHDRRLKKPQAIVATGGS